MLIVQIIKTEDSKVTSTSLKYNLIFLKTLVLFTIVLYIPKNGPDLKTIKANRGSAIL